MQLHMFWALYIHAADHQGVKEDWEKQREVFGDLQRLRELFWNSPLLRDDLALRHVPELAQTLEDYCTRGAYDEFWAAKENDFTRFWHEHADIPATMTTGWYDPFPHADSEYWAAMTAKNESPQRLIIGPWSHVGMRGDATWTLDVDYGPTSVWGVQRYFDEQLEFFNRWLPDDASGQPADEAPVKIFVMGGGSGRRTELGKLDHGGRWRDEQEWPLARAIEHDAASPLRRLASRGGARGRRREPRQFTYDPDDPVPTIGGLYCAVGEMPSGDAELEPAWARLLNPALMLRNIMTPGAADQKESADYFTAREPYQRLSERADVLVYQTEPLEEPLEVTGRVAVELSVSSSALDTDFTAKLVDVYPPSEDYPEGYDLILNDSIIRMRYPRGIRPRGADGAGDDLHGDDPAAADLEPGRASGHRIRVDVSSSNFPRLERNPNTGEPIGRHTHHAVAEQSVHGGTVTLPVIPA